MRFVDKPICPVTDQPCPHPEECGLTSSPSALWRFVADRLPALAAAWLLLACRWDGERAVAHLRELCGR